MSEENKHYERTELDDSQQADKARLVQEAWQKQRELEKLNLKPEEILEEEEKRTNPICIEE
ncbi:MAG: hypothetical protein WA364_07695 [Candidatus Nitrosopolaris sp.]|jgi:hypothetical protein